MQEKNLLSLPNNVLSGVAKGLDYKEILCLRKVCKTLKTFVDIEKPDFDLKYIQISSLMRHEIDCDFGNGVNEMNDVILSNEDPYTKNALETIFGHQKSTLDNLKLTCKLEINEEYYAKILDLLKVILSSRNAKIRTKKLEMNVASQHQVMQILPYIDPEELEQISIFDSFQYTIDPINQLLDLNEICELEQWKNAKVFQSNCILNNATVDDINHFQTIDILTPTVSISILVELKKIFLQFPPIRDFKIRFNQFDEDICIDRLGEPEKYSYQKVTSEKYFIFSIPNDENHVMTIFFDKSRVHISHISKKELSEKEGILGDLGRRMEDEKYGRIRNIRPFLQRGEADSFEVITLD